MPLSFPSADYWSFHAAFSALVLLLLVALLFLELSDVIFAVDISWSLAIIGALFFGSGVASWLGPPTHGCAAPMPLGEEAR